MNAQAPSFRDGAALALVHAAFAQD